MKNANDRFWVEHSLMFFGQVSASLSHEINNVLSIVNELAGLVDDHLLRIDTGLPLDTDKLKETTRKIAVQVQRGEALVKLLNRMAHSADHWIAEVDLGELVARVVAVSRRFAALRKTGLEGGAPRETVAVTTKPFLLQQAVFECIQMCLSAADAKRAVTVGFEPLPAGGARIRVTSADPVLPTEESSGRKAFVALCMEELGGSLAFEPEDDAIESAVMEIPPVIEA